MLETHVQDENHAQVHGQGRRHDSTAPHDAHAADVREAVAQLAADAGVEDNLLAAEVLWTPEDESEVMVRGDIFLNFPELVAL